MIVLENLTKIYRDTRGEEHRAVDGLSLNITRGETVCLIGTSGCGKTTTLRMINRLTDPTEGRILVDGNDIRQSGPVALRRTIGYVIQRGGLFPHMTVGRNVGLLCEMVRWPAERRAARVRELLSLVNLDPDKYANRRPRDLSGGERQRVSIARALALDPPIMLMDEPFSALDPITRDQLHTEFLSLKTKVSKTTLLVTHDMPEAFRLGDRVALMDKGRIVQTGTEQTFRTAPANRFVETFLKTHLSEKNDRA